MIIQKVLRGVGGIVDTDANMMLENGIICNWMRRVSSISPLEISLRLTETNLDWHQNRFTAPDPSFSGAPFCDHTPFISTTAGCIERDLSLYTNTRHRAWFDALQFATNFWSRDGYLFYCYLFVLGKQSVRHQNFAEELRELNIYHSYSLYHLEGEVTAKIIIPSIQIERWEYYDLAAINTIKISKRLPSPTRMKLNSFYELPDHISNIRELI